MGVCDRAQNRLQGATTAFSDTILPRCSDCNVLQMDWFAVAPIGKHRRNKLPSLVSNDDGHRRAQKRQPSGVQKFNEGLWGLVLQHGRSLKSRNSISGMCNHIGLPQGIFNQHQIYMDLLSNFTRWRKTCWQSSPWLASFLANCTLQAASSQDSFFGSSTQEKSTCQPSGAAMASVHMQSVNCSFHSRSYHQTFIIIG